ncbi:hypothetical protein [Paragemmobacter straminiformis]|uniref:Uncharacterized protein n=1 Tax=Paragemmobacter straminiformis TaxID=2045119 RepID=A0A842I9E2_9RHOB|nr:hypothetical protein [Gemmobacter straminiformis]MBC2835608.1 hypothetical protein [Gemmobacter straminiformis]
MQELAEFERRINAALQRIAAGVEGTAPADGAASAEIARLKAELAAERQQTADLRAQLAAAPKAAARPATPGELEARVEKLTRQIDVQGLEMQRMRKNVVQLRENLRALRRAAADKIPDSDQINRAMMAELESIRVTRFAEMAELDEIIAELDPLIAEVS